MRARVRAPLRVRGRPAGGRTVSESPPGKAARGPRLPSFALARPGQAPACALTPPLAASRCSTPTSSMAERARERGTEAGRPAGWPSFRRRSGGLSLLSALTLFGSKLSCQRSRTMSIHGTAAAATARACMATDTACTSIMQRRTYSCLLIQSVDGASVSPPTLN